MSSAKSTPRDAQVMAAILKDMGVADYEPRVINQMLEFTYRYVTDILEDAKVYSTHANKKNLDVDDVKLAVQCKLDHSFTTPPPRELLMDIARHKNNGALPLIKPYTGIKLPPDRYCLSQANYRLRPMKKTQPQLVQVQGTSILPSLSSRVALQSAGGAGLMKQAGGLSGLGGTALTLVTRGLTQPTVTLRPAINNIRLTQPGSSLPQMSSSLSSATTLVKLESLKRKREEDDDYDKL